MSGPNPLFVLRPMLRARRLAAPAPTGVGTVDHSEFNPILKLVRSGGIEAAGTVELESYLEHLAAVEPDSLSRDESLAFWINLYNALALRLAARARLLGHGSVLDVKNGFDSPDMGVAGEALSLDGIEHGKIRRFKDPRIHAALVCGSLSCPTLRHKAFTGAGVDTELDDQMRYFLRAGGVAVNRGAERVELSRVFLWYGADFVRPRRMPTLIPARRRTVLGALARWLPGDLSEWVDATDPEVGFKPYDWGLGCAVRPNPDVA